jgi:hypothetical protein
MDISLQIQDTYGYGMVLEWDDVGNVTGPQGVQGTTGTQGVQGTTGTQGIQGLLRYTRNPRNTRSDLVFKVYKVL